MTLASLFPQSRGGGCSTHQVFEGCYAQMLRENKGCVGASDAGCDIVVPEQCVSGTAGHTFLRLGAYQAMCLHGWDALKANYLSHGAPTNRGHPKKKLSIPIRKKCAVHAVQGQCT